MTRPTRTTAELIAASEHLHYEIWMFVALANGMASGIVGQGPINNALLESFTVHGRILLDFLYSDKPQADDVIAEDFFPDPDQWLQSRPPKTDLLKSVHRRVAKEVAHLTYARQVVTPETKPWPFVQVANDVNAVFSRFLSKVPLNSLGPNWEDLKRQRREGEAA